LAAWRLLLALPAWVWPAWLALSCGGGPAWLCCLWVARHFSALVFLPGFPGSPGLLPTAPGSAAPPLGGVWLLRLSARSPCLLSPRLPWAASSRGRLRLYVLLALWLGGLALRPVAWPRRGVTVSSPGLRRHTRPRPLGPGPSPPPDACPAALCPGAPVVCSCGRPPVACPCTPGPRVCRRLAALLRPGRPCFRALRGRFPRPGCVSPLALVAACRSSVPATRWWPFRRLVPLERSAGAARPSLPCCRSFSRGPAVQAPLHAAGSRLAPFLCYAAVFPPRRPPWPRRPAPGAGFFWGFLGPFPPLSRPTGDLAPGFGALPRPLRSPWPAWPA